MNIGVTGHQNIAQPENWEWVARELKETLARFPQPITGVTCLAPGADQVFARVVLESGGAIHAVIPFSGYEDMLDGEERFEYLNLLAEAVSATHLERNGNSDEEAYFIAGQVVVEMSEVLVAVWDGMPAGGLGGTGDVVALALETNTRVMQINPDTQTSQEL
jgi:hypothetical protein